MTPGQLAAIARSQAEIDRTSNQFLAAVTACDRYCSDTWTTFGPVVLDTPGLIYSVLELHEGNFDWSDTEGAGLFVSDTQEWMNAENRYWVNRTGYRVY